MKSMNIDDVLKLAAILGSGAATVGIPLVFVQFRHRRAANFTAAWKAIESGLQDKDVRIGRAVCRSLNGENRTNTPLKEFPNDEVCGKVLMEIERDRVGERIAKAGGRACLEEYVSRAYDAFDLAAILAWHSRIPGLWHALVAEWEDGIISTWEVGAPILRKRYSSRRRELYECFSVLYEAARRYRDLDRGLYPYRGPLTMLSISRPRWWAASRARQLRNEVLSQLGVPASIESH